MRRDRVTVGRATAWVLLGLLATGSGALAGETPDWPRENDAAVAEFRAANRAPTPAEALAGLQRALDRLDALLLHPAPDAASLRRARSDRVVVLAALGKNSEALQAVAALEGEGAPLPAYVLSSAGDAAAGLPDPAQALAWYERALAADPGLESAHAGRIFALADLDRLDEAERILRERLKGAPPGPATARDELRLSMVLAWRGDLDEALARSQALLEAWPADADVAIESAGVLLQAERPRDALARYEAALARTPGSRRALLGRAQALERLARWDEAQAAYAALGPQEPGWRPLARARESSEADRAAQLSFTLRTAEGPDRELAGSEWLREARLSSPRSRAGWRAFVGTREAQAEYQGQDLRDRRHFIGASLQRGDWRVRGQLNRPDDGFSDEAGWALDVDWQPADRLSLSLGYAQAAYDLPLRGRAVGTVGDRWSLAARWQPSAQHAIRASLGSTDYSDGNRSKTLGLGTSHRSSLGRRSTLTLEPALFASRQSRQDVPYFSPEHDLSVELGGALEQRLWLRPGRRLAHALEFGFGQQRQSGFDPDVTARLAYRLDWDVSPGTRLFLRIGRSRRAYDGVPEYQTRLELGGWWSL